jgi:peptidyl-prolyl cis-trans isomerase D
MFRWKDKSINQIDRIKLQRNFWTYVVLLTALGAMTFFGVCDPTGQMGGPGVGVTGSAAVVDGEKITRSDFNRAYQSAYQNYQRQYQDGFDPTAMRLAHNVMKELVDDRAMYLKAVDLGLRASDEEVIEILKRAEQFKAEDGKFSQEGFRNFLSSQGYTEASFMEEVRRSITVQKLRRFVTEAAYVSSKQAEIEYKLAETKLDVEYIKFDPQQVKVTVDAAQVDKFLADDAGKAKVKEQYEQNSKEYNQGEQVKARHILVSFKGARNATADAAKRSKEDAKKRADDVLAKVKGGADFAQTAKEMTDEASGKTSGGDLGWFAKEAMVKEFSDAAFALKAGELSGVVESPFGFHVIKVEEKKDAKNVTLEQAQREIAEQILSKETRPKLAREQADKVLAELNAGQPASGAMAQYGVAWQATGEFAANTRYLPGIGSSKEVSDAIAALSKVGQIYTTPVDVRGNLYVLKLKSRTEPDMSKFDAEKRKQLRQSAAFSDGFAYFNTFEKQTRDALDKSKSVWMNPDYLALDNPRPDASAAPGS